MLFCKELEAQQARKSAEVRFEHVEGGFDRHQQVLNTHGANASLENLHISSNVGY